MPRSHAIWLVGEEYESGAVAVFTMKRECIEWLNTQPRRINDLYVRRLPDGPPLRSDGIDPYWTARSFLREFD